MLLDQHIDLLLACFHPIEQIVDLDCCWQQK
jgi:hypothetical protein